MTPNLAAALVAAMKDAEAVGKDARNSFHNYKYASAEAIISEAREALGKNGLTLMPTSLREDTVESRASGEPRRIVIKYLLVHSSGESLEVVSSAPVCPEKGRPEDKAEFGARTECLAYTLRDLLLLPRVNEEDLPSARDDRPAPEKKAPPAPKERPAPKEATFEASLYSPPTAKSAPAPTHGPSAGDARTPPPGVVGITPETVKRVTASVKALNLGERQNNLNYISHFAGRKIGTSLELTETEGVRVSEAAEAGEVAK